MSEDKWKFTPSKTTAEYLHKLLRVDIETCEKMAAFEEIIWKIQRGQYSSEYRKVYNLFQKDLKSMASQIHNKIHEKVSREEFYSLLGNKIAINKIPIYQKIGGLYPAIGQFIEAAFDWSHYVHSAHIAIIIRMLFFQIKVEDKQLTMNPIFRSSLIKILEQMFDNVLGFTNRSTTEYTYQLVNSFVLPGKYIKWFWLDIARQIVPSQVSDNPLPDFMDDLQGRPILNEIYYFIRSKDNRPELVKCPW